MIEWFSANKEWVFSGIGVAFLSLIGRYICKKSLKNRQSQTAGNNSRQYQYLEQEGESDQSQVAGDESIQHQTKKKLL